MSSLLPYDALPIGLGCSRLGSIGGATPVDAGHLLQRAYEEGVRFFDTSNIYGQGDSERILGKELAKHEDVVFASKAGKFFPWQRRMLFPFKRVIRSSTRRIEYAREHVASARANPMPTRWDSTFLTKSLDASLRRLKRDRIEVYLLHSPSIRVIQDGEAMYALEQAQTAGKIGIAGVSVDDSETALACLNDKRVGLLQLPLRPAAHGDFDRVLDEAVRAGVPVIAREILGGAGQAPRLNPVEAQRRIVEVIRDPRVTLPLVGATKISTLTASLESARFALNSNSEPRNHIKKAT